MLENFFKNIDQTVKPEEKAARKETPSSLAPTVRVLQPEDLTEVVDEADVYGPLESLPETLAQPESQTLKTDSTVALEKQAKAEAIAESAPTVRAEESMTLKAAEAQTFKTGETIAREDAAKEAADQKYQAQIAQEKINIA